MENKNYFKISNLLIISMLLILFMIPAGSFAQTAANFSGTWVYNESKSNLGEGGFRMVSQKLVITQEANAFSIERAFTNQNGEERKTSEKYTLDGKESKNPVFNTEKKSKATWSADKQALTVNSIMVLEMNGEKNEIKTTEVYTLGDAGKTLAVNSTSTSSRGERKATLVYEKK
jgi:hypothetical protein